ncbi:MAG TPA: DNA polymerase III subunit gamma/tau, partial [Sulfurovum sp.]|nr:DNA polymerase III subunit gamma/tau [Sulfurovum sp.]
MFVKECFGLETKIVNISKKKVVDTSTNSVTEVKKVTEPVEVVEVPHNDANTSSMIEDEMKSSCIAPSAGDTEAAKEKDPSTLLQEPMVKEAIALFDPKKVRIKRNS